MRACSHEQNWQFYDPQLPAGDYVVVVANFFHEPQDGYVIGFPAAGTWKLRFNSDWQGYSDEFQDHPSSNVVAEPGEYDSFPFQAVISMGH
jgi:1,4-alpha-glucan branching enzyme